MTRHPNGNLPAVRVPDDTGRAGALLDELDSLIAELDAALADANAARLVITDAETEIEMITASVTLDTTGPNETARKAAITLALRDDPEYQTHAQAARHARAGLLDAERRAAVVRQRIALVRAALALLTNGSGQDA